MGRRKRLAARETAADKDRKRRRAPEEKDETRDCDMKDKHFKSTQPNKIKKKKRPHWHVSFSTHCSKEGMEKVEPPPFVNGLKVN